MRVFVLLGFFSLLLIPDAPIAKGACTSYPTIVPAGVVCVNIDCDPECQRLCVDWEGDEENPEVNVDFTVTIDCDADPGPGVIDVVTLKAARDDWLILAVDSQCCFGGPPAHINKITIDPLAGEGDYKIKIMNSAEDNDWGADDINDIILTPASG